MENTEEIVGGGKKANLFLAILCAIGLGIAGCLAWGVLYYLGFIAWVAAYIVVFGAAWGYKKFNQKMDVKGYIIISVIAVAEILLTLMLTTNIGVMVALIGDGYSVGFFESFSLMFQVVSLDASIRNAMITDSVLSLVFIAIGIVSHIFIERRNNKRGVGLQENLVAMESIVDVNTEEGVQKNQINEFEETIVKKDEVTQSNSEEKKENK